MQSDNVGSFGKSCCNPNPSYCSRPTSPLSNSRYSLVGDPDPAVSMNSLSVLEEILADQGGLTLNTAMMHFLLNRLVTCSEWGQNAILNLLARYDVRSEQEIRAR